MDGHDVDGQLVSSMHVGSYILHVRYMDGRNVDRRVVCRVRPTECFFFRFISVGLCGGGFGAPEDGFSVSEAEVAFNRDGAAP